MFLTPDTFGFVRPSGGGGVRGDSKPADIYSILNKSKTTNVSFAWKMPPFFLNPFRLSIFLTSGAAVIAFSILDSIPVEQQPGEVKRDMKELKIIPPHPPLALRITISYISQTRFAPISSSDCRHQSPADAVAENIKLVWVCRFVGFFYVYEFMGIRGATGVGALNEERARKRISGGVSL